MIKTAIIGASGYIGKYLLRHYRKQFPDCIGTGFSRVSDSLLPFDLRNPDVASLRLKETEHEAVIISSAIPNIAKCEAYPQDSYDLNVSGTLKLVTQLEQLSIKTIFFSSDYVFDGMTGNYSDDTKTSPITEYGRQKAKVEQEIPNLTNNYVIIRLSKIYGTIFQDGTLLDSLAASLINGEKVTVATDQIFSPTHVEDVVSMLLFIQQEKANGLINLCHHHAYSRYDIAFKLAQKLKISTNQLNSVPLHSIPTMENRPLNTSLKCSALLQSFKDSLITIDEAVEHVAANWKNRLKQCS